MLWKFLGNKWDTKQWGFFLLRLAHYEYSRYTSNGFVGPLIVPWVTDHLKVFKAHKEPRVGAFRSATSLRYFGKYTLNKLLGGLLSFRTVIKSRAAFSGLSFPRQMCNHSTSLLLDCLETTNCWLKYRKPSRISDWWCCAVRLNVQF